MATILNNIPGICFPVELDCITIDSAGSSVVHVRFVLDGTAIFNTYLVPDANGIIQLFNLASLFSEFMQNFQQYRLQIEVDDESLLSVVLLPCMIDVGMTASTFVERHFLTLLNGPKTISKSAMETLTWFNASAETEERSDTELLISSTWWNDTTGVMMEISEVRTIHEYSTGCFSADVSPAGLTEPEPSEECRLLQYVVRCGSREQSYVIVPVVSQSVRFKNSFQVFDSFHFWGSIERENKVERSQTYFNGSLRTYYTDDASEEKYYSGLLPDAVIPLIEDLSRSRDIYLYPSDRAVVITGSEIKTKNDSEAFNEANVTFRQSSRIECLTLKERCRTFDETFDETFY